MIGNAPVVLQTLSAPWLLVQRSHRDVADLEEFGCREKHEIDRVVIDRVDDTAFVEEDDIQPAPLQFDAARQPRGTCAYNCDIKDFPGVCTVVHDLSRAST